jgi:hypothetical protein
VDTTTFYNLPVYEGLTISQDNASFSAKGCTDSKQQIKQSKHRFKHSKCTLPVNVSFWAYGVPATCSTQTTSINTFWVTILSCEPQWVTGCLQTSTCAQLSMRTFKMRSDKKVQERIHARWQESYRNVVYEPQRVRPACMQNNGTTREQASWPSMLNCNN